MTLRIVYLINLLKRKMHHQDKRKNFRMKISIVVPISSIVDPIRRPLPVNITLYRRGSFYESTSTKRLAWGCNSCILQCPNLLLWAIDNPRKVWRPGCTSLNSRNPKNQYNHRILYCSCTVEPPFLESPVGNLTTTCSKEQNT